MKFRMGCASTISMCALVATLSGCAINPAPSLDPSKTVLLQSFRAGNYQGKLVKAGTFHQLQFGYIQIDLGDLPDAEVDYAGSSNGYDLISVRTPTADCPHAHRLYQIQGFLYRRWNLNDNGPGCTQPIKVTERNGALDLVQAGTGIVRNNWTWENAELYLGSFAPIPVRQPATGTTVPTLPGKTTGPDDKGSPQSTPQSPGSPTRPTKTMPTEQIPRPPVKVPERTTPPIVPAPQAPVQPPMQVPRANPANQTIPAVGQGRVVVSPAEVARVSKTSAPTEAKPVHVDLR